MSFAIILTFALTLMGLALASMILVAVWVYRDAKSRGVEAWVWTLVTLLVPSFIGLLLYFLVGRKEGRRPCPACGKQVPLKSTFCGYCGNSLDVELPAQPQKTVGKGLLVAGIVGIVLTLVLGFASMLALMIEDDFFEDFDFMSVSTIYLENHGRDHWSVSYHYTNKSPDQSIRISDNGPRQIYYEGSCEEGPLTLRVWQGDFEVSVDLSGGNTVQGNVDLSAFEPGKVHMELDNDHGEGRRVEFKAWWE